MHESRDISSILWKGKRPVLLLSTNAQPIGFPCKPVDVVPCCNGAIREDIHSSSMHKEYTGALEVIGATKCIITTFLDHFLLVIFFCFRVYILLL
jgi:hypothetical protein